MSIQIATPTTLRQRLIAANHPFVGIWACAASPLTAEICASSGMDIVLIDAEHSPNDLSSLLAQLHACGAYDAHTIVRVPLNDERLLKQYLDLGVRTIIVPMVHSPEEAAAAAARVTYPPRGVRGVGAALARASMWNRIPDYLAQARETIDLIVQIESSEGVRHAHEIASTEGIDGIFVGPADLAADMGILGQAEDERVVQAVDSAIRAGKEAGKIVGTNAFNPVMACHYFQSGADFVLVGADVTILARGVEALRDQFDFSGEH